MVLDFYGSIIMSTAWKFLGYKKITKEAKNTLSIFVKIKWVADDIVIAWKMYIKQYYYCLKSDKILRSFESQSPHGRY